MNSRISHDELIRILDYDPTTGIFIWKNPVCTKLSKGDIAGCFDAHGYRKVCVGSVAYKGHRLAWFYVNGTWPDKTIDHINGDRSDNRIINLRLVTPSESTMNSSKRRDGATSKYR